MDPVSEILCLERNSRGLTVSKISHVYCNTALSRLGIHSQIFMRNVIFILECLNTNFLQLISDSIFRILSLNNICNSSLLCMWWLYHTMQVDIWSWCKWTLFCEKVGDLWVYSFLCTYTYVLMYVIIKIIWMVVYDISFISSFKQTVYAMIFGIWIFIISAL
jgi:hypothetical protein